MRVLLGLQFKAFLRRIPLVACALLFALVVAALGVRELMVALDGACGLFETLGQTTRYLLVWPVVFVVLTYEFASGAARCDMHEAVAAHGERSHLHWLAVAAVPATLLAVTFVLHLSLRLAVVFVLAPRAILVRHVALAAMLDVLVPATIAVLLGLVLAKWAKRFAAFAAIVGFAFLVGPYAEIVPGALVFATLDSGRVIDIYRAFDVVRIMPPDPVWFVDALYGFPMEFVRWAVAGLWIAGLLAILLPSLAGRRGGISRFLPWVAGIVAVACLGLFMLPGSVIRRDARPSGAADGDQIYYEIQAETHPPRDVAADFRAAGYRMELDVGRELEAEVTVDIAQDEHADGYRFTLYHGYRISRVLGAGGEELEFTQDGDYVTVISAKDQTSLRFEYAGSGGGRVANYQCVYLPGYFPYYPVPGFRRMWDPEASALSVSIGERPMAEFDATVRSVVHVISNLDGDDGHFEGSSAALSLAGGLLAQDEVRGVRAVYYPASGASAQTVDEMLEAVERLQTTIGSTDDAIPGSVTIIQIPEIAQSNATAIALADTIFVAVPGDFMAGDVLLSSHPIGPDRALVRDAFVGYLRDPERFAQDAEQFGPVSRSRIDEIAAARQEALRETAENAVAAVMSEAASRDVVYRLFYDKIQRCGEKAVLRDSYTYLTSSDPVSEIEFLTQDTNGVEP